MTDHSAALREPWESLEHQREAATFGIWVFLASEVLFFSGLFMLYAVLRSHSMEFVRAARDTNIWFGTINTAVLMTSSLTMGIASQGASAGYRRVPVWCLAATALLGMTFLVLKGFEYREDIMEGFLPGSAKLAAEPVGQTFWSLYWIATVVHAVHLTIGIGLVSRLFLHARRHTLVVRASPQVEVTALYWHLVDIIWIFLYPLLYLAGRA